jgi:hypothetical protein
MIKTQTNEENRFMKRILPHYYRYVTENPHTFLVRIYGMHRVKMYHLNRKVHFVIMGSVFDTPCQINTIYDLKGSLVGRSATPEERASGGVLKDNDLILDGNKLKLGSKRDLFINQLEKDATFLSQLNIMDYSLLVCEAFSSFTLSLPRWESITALADIPKKSNPFPRQPQKRTLSLALTRTPTRLSVRKIPTTPTHLGNLWWLRKEARTLSPLRPVM